VAGPISFKSDNVWSYELGEKLRLADNRVTINGSVYFEKWNNVQQANSLSSCGYTYTANTGNAHVLRWRSSRSKAIVVRDLDGVGERQDTRTATLVSTNLIDAGFDPGTPIQQVPQWTSSESIAYRHGLTDQLALIARAESTYTWAAGRMQPSTINTAALRTTWHERSRRHRRQSAGPPYCS
jgi:iron complex outermembrane receptor protein